MKFFRTFRDPDFLDEISKAFSFRVQTFGSTPAGVLWKSKHGQQLRFEVLSGILSDHQPSTPISISDFGCGYGAMYDFLIKKPSMTRMSYFGYDISKEMIKVARRKCNDSRATFIKSSKVKASADYTFVSGTFNLNLKMNSIPWGNYVKSTLSQLWSMSNKGLAFNMLDEDHPNKESGLYYASAEEYLDFCKMLSPKVILIDSYQLDEWTIFINR